MDINVSQPEIDSEHIRSRAMTFSGSTHTWVIGWYPPSHVDFAAGLRHSSVPGTVIGIHPVASTEFLRRMQSIYITVRRHSTRLYSVKQKYTGIPKSSTTLNGPFTPSLDLVTCREWVSSAACADSVAGAVVSFLPSRCPIDHISDCI